MLNQQDDEVAKLEKRKLFVVVIMTIMVSLQSAYLLFFHDNKTNSTRPNPVHSETKLVQTESQPQSESTEKQKPHDNLEIYRNQLKVLESLLPSSSPKSISWDENEARHIISLRFHEGKVIYAEVMQPDAMPASKAEYWFYHNQLLKADLLSGQTKSAGGRSSAGVTQTSWRLRQSFWFDEQGNVVDSIKKFQDDTLLARYQNCGVCASEAKMIMDNAPDDWHQPVDEKQFKLP